MENIIYIEPSNSREFSTFCFYNSLLPLIREHYKKNKTQPIFSFEKLQYISPLVLPNILGIGYYLSRYHNNPIKLKLNYTPKILYYLYKTDFFKIAGENNEINRFGLNIFEFDERFLGGFSSYIEKEQRKEHKLHYYYPIENPNNDIILHDGLLEDLSLSILPLQFEGVLSDRILSESLDESIESIAEPISNGILHSNSVTWAISQTTPGVFSKTILSIVDVGVGFEKSLEKQGYIPVIIKMAKSMGIYKKTLNDFFYIMEALYFSIINERHGLVDFIIKITNSGTVRIHYQSTQIILTNRIFGRCSGLISCRNEIKYIYSKQNSISDKLKNKAGAEIINLSKLILSLSSYEKRYSAIRIFDIVFKGVHIEFEIK